MTGDFCSGGIRENPLGGKAGHVAMSIETRKEVGETYSAERGFFRYYELIYTISDERDGPSANQL